MALSIRWRLTLWNTSALAVVLIGVALLVYGLVSHSLYGQIDRKLRAAVDQLERDERMASDQPTRLRYWLEEFKEHDNLFGVIYGADGSLGAKTPELAADAVPPLPRNSTATLRFRDAEIPIVG